MDFSDEAYTQKYHELYAEFLNTVDPAQITDDACALIAGYVKKDPTKFCTYEEFETGVQVLKTFCSLRRESVQGQLEGTVPAVSAEQKADWEALVNADDMNLSDMGTMNNGGGPGEFAGPGGEWGRSLENVRLPNFGADIPDNGGAQQPGQMEQTDRADLSNGEMNRFPPEKGGMNQGEMSPPTGQSRNGNFLPPGATDGAMPRLFTVKLRQILSNQELF